MRILKKIVGILGIVLILFIGVMLAIPYFFKDEIISTLQQEINQNLNASVDFESVDISLFKAFPNLCVGIHQLNIKGRDKFEDIQLLSASSIEITMNLLDLFKRNGPIVVRQFTMDRPVMNIWVLEDGSANYDIVVEDPSSTNETGVEAAYQMHLHKYEIINGLVNYRDEASDITVQMNGLNHTGKGDFTATVFDLNTETHIDALSAKMQGISYLKEAFLDYHAKIKVDLNEMTFTLLDNEMTLNDLILSADGQLKMPDDNIYIAMDVQSPTTNFKSLWSLIPGAFIQGYERVQSRGTFTFKASVNGLLNVEKEILPSFSVALQVNDGAVQYPDFPMGISSINTSLNLKNTSGNIDDTKLHIPTFSFSLGQNTMSGSLQLSKPISNPTLQMAIKGNFNLEDLSKAFPMEGVTELSGALSSDFKVNGTWIDMENADYGQIKASGFLTLNNLRYKEEALPEFAIKNCELNFTPSALQIKIFESTLGKSDVLLKGKITNYLAFFSTDKYITGQLSLQSRRMDMNEWMDGEVDPTDSAVVVTSEAPFDRFDFSWDAAIDKLIYEDFILEGITGQGQISPDKLAIRDIQFNIGKSDFKGNGTVNNVFNYIYKNQALDGQIKVTSRYCDLNEIMGVGMEPTTEEEIYVVPENISMLIDASMENVIYTNMQLTNLNGAVDLDNQQIKIKNMRANTLGGNIQMTGMYNTQNPVEPTFKLDYKLNKIDFKQAFNTFNTFKRLAPIGQFLSGSFNTDMSMNGLIGQDMLPELNSINADGFLQTFNSILSNFIPFRKVGETLNIDEMQDMVIQDVKTWFEVRNGSVEVKEFPYVWKGISMRIKGKHGIDQSMDYNIRMNVPKSLIKNANLQKAAERGMTLLSRQANKLGINIAESKFVNINVRLTGSMDNPKVGIQLIGVDGNVTKVVDEIKNRTKDIIDNTIDSTKTVIDQKVKDTKDDLKSKANEEIAIVMKKAEKASNELRIQGYRLAEEAQKKGYAQADELLQKAGNNPLKKIAAREAAKVLKKETDKKVVAMKSTTDKKAKAILEKAEQKSAQIRKKYGITE